LSTEQEQTLDDFTKLKEQRQNIQLAYDQSVKDYQQLQARALELQKANDDLRHRLFNALNIKKEYEAYAKNVIEHMWFQVPKSRFFDIFPMMLKDWCEKDVFLAFDSNGVYIEARTDMELAKQ